MCPPSNIDFSQHIVQGLGFMYIYIYMCVYVCMYMYMIKWGCGGCGGLYVVRSIKTRGSLLETKYAK